MRLQQETYAPPVAKPLPFRRGIDPDTLALRSAYDALLDGRFPRRLSGLERLSLALTAAAPLSFLTLDSPSMSRDEAIRAYRCFVKRYNRKRSGSTPLIYYATVPRSVGGSAGHHIHALVWEYVPFPVAVGAARAVGLGGPRFSLITAEQDLYFGLRGVTYVMGQQEPVFGRTHQNRHMAREKHKRAYLNSSRKVIGRHLPQLLAAIDLAKDPMVTDESLVLSLPLFSREVEERKRLRLDARARFGV
jgi:hypothetical protein